MEEKGVKGLNERRGLNEEKMEKPSRGGFRGPLHVDLGMPSAT